ncbi:translocation/assembly module TamB domain-containing protein [Palleronia sp. KMU-117]|uniref:translocation/assembly module TamB domain-containing protein n=1 Tax=Palleronia sp. KMU-117 TaxID=3434108 RepID=UPI003D750523
MVLSAPAVAQDDSSRGDASFLERQIEGALSGDDRDVVIEGFRGLLGGQATFDRLTISDRDGVWLTVTDVELDWSRLALLRRRLEVTRLTAGSVEFTRLPAPTETPPSPEASAGFALPELPVAVRIGEISVGNLSLGEALFGRAASLSLAGSANLEGGAGQADLTASRLDGEGTFRVNGSYANETDFLDLSLVVDEAPDGILVNLLDVPDVPSLRLVVDGRAPLSDFTAELVLATDGVDRLAGRVTTRAGGTPDAPERSFTANIGGDVTSLFLPEYREFFGPSLIVGLDAARLADGSFRIDDLDLQAEALLLSAEAEIGPDRLPRRLRVTGQIATRDGAPVLLPLPGDPVRLRSAEIGVRFDADQSDDWQARIALRDLETGGVTAEEIALDGAGTIRPESPGRSVTAALELAARGLDLGGNAVDAALGRDMTASADLDWTEGTPLQVRDLEVEGATFGLRGSGSVSGLGEGIAIGAELAIDARDLAVFSGLAKRDIGGAVAADLDLTYEALTGQFDVTLDARSSDLRVDQPEADRILAGMVRLGLRAVRDETGTRVERLALTSPNAEVSGQVTLTSARSTARLSAQFADAALLHPTLSGALALEADAETAGDDWSYRINGDGTGTRFAVTGTANTSGAVPEASADVDLSVADLSVFSALAGRPLAGTISVGGEVSGLTDLSRVAANLSGTASALAIGQAQADALLAGVTDFRVAGSLQDSVPTVDTLTVRNAALDLTASGTLRSGEGTARVEGRLADTAIVLPGAVGPSTLRLTADERQDGLWAFDLAGASPFADATARGAAAPFATPQSLSADLSVDARDLSRLSGLAGRPLAGAAQLSGRLDGTSDLEALDIDLQLQTTNVAIGIAEVDRLLAGRALLDLDFARNGENLTIRDVRLDSPALKASVAGDVTNGAGQLAVSAALANLGLFVPDFPGPVTADGTVAIDGARTATVNLALTGPGGIAATVRGDVVTEGPTLALRVNGRAPLEIANRFITPNSVSGTLGFDLSVNGPPALSSVSGTLTTSGARVALPGTGVSLENLAVNTGIENGRANLSVTSGVQGGGSLSVSGPVELAPPFNATLAIAARGVVLTDPTLYRTSLTGDLRVSGPLAGGASISGNVDVGETEISIAGTGAGASGPIPEIIHLNEPADVRRTRQFAGLIREDRGEGRSIRPYPLDVTINAPRIFVRGRGLDAELSGGMRVTGTTANVVPIGQIDLVRGRLGILGGRLRVTEGEIVLGGSLVPILRLEAVSEIRSDDDVRAFVSVDGPVTDPQFRFLSEPPLPEDEVLARILFGTDLANISALQAAQLASAAATLSGGGGPGIMGNLRSGLGIDDLDVRTDEQGRTAVTAGTYINERLYADVTTRSDGDTEINLNFDITTSVTGTVSTSNQGDSSVGVFFRRDY